jgi:hypothetical protein
VNINGVARVLFPLHGSIAMEAHPVKTAWTGHFFQNNKKHDVQFDNVVFGHGGVLSGWGEDAIGNFQLNGEYTINKVKFSKTYTTGKAVGQSLLQYKGDMYWSPDGMKITGQYSFPERTNGPTGDFQILRSKELEEKRKKAFKAVLANLKVKVGMFRFFAEDFWMHIAKVYYVVLNFHGGLLSYWFTILSLVAGVGMSFAGPVLEARVARAMAAGSGGTTFPSISDGKNRKSKQQHAKKKEADKDDVRNDYKLMKDAEEDVEGASQSIQRSQTQAYQQHLEEAKEITTAEYFTGNLDYIAALMENPKPAEVIDVGICDVIKEAPLVGKALVFTTSAFWLYTVAFPFLFEVNCDAGIPATAHLVFFMTAFFNVFVQIWCASLTKYGYLMMVHAPQMYFFDVGLSFLGLFSSYSSVAWIVQIKSCGSWLWQPAAAVYFIGMFLLQAVLGTYLLLTGKMLPIALRLTQNNLLVALLKPDP